MPKTEFDINELVMIHTYCPNIYGHSTSKYVDSKREILRSNNFLALLQYRFGPKYVEARTSPFPIVMISIIKISDKSILPGLFQLFKTSDLC